MATCRTKYLSLKDFNLQYDRPADFTSCLVCRSSVWYGVLVTCMSIHAVTMSVYTGITSVYAEKIFIWLTYWSYFALTTRFLVTSLNVWRAMFVQKTKRNGTACSKASKTRNVDTGRPLNTRHPDTTERTGMPVLYKLQWVLQNVSGTSALLVTALYWTVMFDPKKHESFRSINSHVLNTVLVLTDVVMSRAPVRFVHCLHCFLFIAAYVLFTAVYWAFGGVNHEGEDYIYPLLNYSKHPGKAVLVFIGVAFLATPFLQAVLYVAFRLREWIIARCLEKNPNLTNTDVNNALRRIAGRTDENKENNDTRNPTLTPTLTRNPTLSDVQADGDDEIEETNPIFFVDNETVISGQKTKRTKDYAAERPFAPTYENVHAETNMDEERTEIRPMLQSETSQISCTESTKGLLI